VLSAIGLLLTLHLAAPLAHAATTAPVANALLRVVTTPIAPFVLPNTDPPAGFSVDLWKELARRLRVDFAWQVVGYADLLRAVERGEADVAIAAIAMTPERDKSVDFTHPYFDTGLQILVRVRGEGRFLDTFRSVPWAAIGELFGVAILVILLLANVLWLVERRGNPRFRRKYLPAIGEGLWGSMLIIATGEHGDRDAPNVIKRIVVAAMWLLGVVLIAQLTATVTSTQTVARLQSDIRGPGDLAGKKIASVPGTIAADYLTRLGLPYAGITNADEGIRMITQGEVQAIVFDAPTLQYYAAKRGGGVLQVVGPIFRPEKIAIAVREGSPLRKRINEALLEIYADGTYEDIYAKWFSRGN
jgi:ABC-type amino acid transport substrate-binding protein